MTGDAVTGPGVTGKGRTTTGRTTTLLQISATTRCTLATGVVAGLWAVVGWAMQWW